jgi:predicted HAD superfamily hydrolase
MTKELFIKAIEALKKQRDIDIEVAKHLGVVFPYAFEANLLPNNESLKNMLVEILQEEMNDVENCWIKHFCWVLNFGSKNDHLKVYKNGIEIPMANAVELYEFLINV